jgi:hypothetical protein
MIYVLLQVESDVVVPVSDTQLSSASALRAKVSAVRSYYMTPVPTLTVAVPSMDTQLPGKLQVVEDDGESLDVTCPVTALAGNCCTRTLQTCCTQCTSVGGTVYSTVIYCEVHKCYTLMSLHHRKQTDVHAFVHRCRHYSLLFAVRLACSA